MACWQQHHFELDFALRNASWRPAERFGYAGWRAGAKGDAFNRLATYPDEIADWLWQKEPWFEAALRFGLGSAQASFARGDLKAAALKFALLSHYVVDVLAVSHTWLEFIGEIEDFADEPSLKAFHDPVENLPAEELARARPAASDGDFDRLYPAAVARAYALGQQAFQTYFECDARACWPLVVEGIASSAPVALALAEAVATPGPSSTPHSALRTPQCSEWVMRVIFEAPNAEAILEHLADPRQRAAVQERLGWKGGDVFFAPEKCSPQARAAYGRWRADRDVWRANQMRTVLSSRPAEKITAAWRTA